MSGYASKAEANGTTAELDTPTPAPDYADAIAARILGSSDNTHAYRAAVEAARAGYALGLGVSS